jgi:hypothetical protein
VKIFFSGYDKFIGNDRPDDFFQFGLDVRRVKKDFKRLGFQCLHTMRENGWGGLQRLLRVAGRISSWQQEVGAKNRFMRLLMLGIGFLLAPLCSHNILMVFNKR